MSNSDIRYLSVEQVLVIRDQLADQYHEMFDILRFQQLLSAIAAPQQVIFGEELFPTICAKAAKLLGGLIRNHPFWDGNKRIAVAATRAFLQLNGYELVASQAEIDAWTLHLAQTKADDVSSDQWIDQHIRLIQC